METENVIMPSEYPTPEEQAEILLQNYVKSSSVYINGRDRRKMKRELLRNAKKGKYKRIFGISNMTIEESKEHFSDLNA